MHRLEILREFSLNRLGGEPVPEDLKVLLLHRDELARRTGFSLNWDKEWTPWLDSSYLSEDEKADPDISANVRATEEVCALIAFVAAYEDDEYLGFWRGPSLRPVANSPLVYFDNEGQFSLCGGESVSEAILAHAYDEDDFGELSDWMRSIGISIRWDSREDISYPEDSPPPHDVHDLLYKRFRAQ